jgi:hypothetical protein
MKATLRGNERIAQFLSIVARGAKITAMRAIAEYLLGDERHGLRYSPPRVNHNESNPYRWTSEKQRRAYFATDGFGGGIPYQRTGNLAEAWTMEEANSDWNTVKLTNNSEYGQYVQGDEQQVGHKADGWRLIATIIRDNINGAIRAGQQAVDRFIKSKG